MLNSNGSYGRFYSWSRLLSFTLAMILIEFFYTTLTTGISIGTSERDAEVGLTLAVFLVWLVYNLKLRPNHVFLLVWLTMFVVRFLNNMVGGYFMTFPIDNASDTLESLGFSFLISFLIAAAAGFILLHPEFNDSLWERSRKMLSLRNRNQWILRIALSTLIFIGIYFAFGTAVSPFVYPGGTQGTVNAQLGISIAIELLRGLIYTLALIPLIIAVGTGRLNIFLAASMMLFIPGSLIPLVESEFTIAVILIHMGELLADSLIFSLMLTLLFAPQDMSLTSGRTIAG